MGLVQPTQPLFVDAGSLLETFDVLGDQPEGTVRVHTASQARPRLRQDWNGILRERRLSLARRPVFGAGGRGEGRWWAGKTGSGIICRGGEGG